jgi:hypothetical protein
MSKFLKGSQVVLALEDLIKQADEYCWIISPYLQLPANIKNLLHKKKSDPRFHIIVVFGRLETGMDKYLCKEDFEFLKQFPNITIGYEKRLKARYYASEDIALLTSFHLQPPLQPGNVEVAIKMRSENRLRHSTSSSIDADCFNYFLTVIEGSTIVFEKDPAIKNKTFNPVYNRSLRAQT